MGRSSAQRAGAAFLFLAGGVSYTQDDLDRIEHAIAQSVMSVTFADGRQVQFSTFAELVARRNYIARHLGLEGGRQRLFSEFKKGVCP